MKKRCYFCDCELNDGEDIKNDRAKEHLFEKSWLTKLGYLKAPSFKHTFSGNEITSDVSLVPDAMQAGAVCQGCNMGWLNDTDVAFQTTFFELLDNPNLLDNLTEDQKFLMSRYIFKTALVAISMQSSYKDLIPLELREKAMDLSFLPSGFICLAKYLDPPLGQVAVSVLNEWHYNQYIDFIVETVDLNNIQSKFKVAIRFDNLIIGCAYIDFPWPCFYYHPGFYKLIYSKDARYAEVPFFSLDGFPKNFVINMPENAFTANIHGSILRPFPNPLGYILK